MLLSGLRPLCSDSVTAMVEQYKETKQSYVAA